MNRYIGIDRQNIMRAGLNRLGISVENMRRMKLLNNGKLDERNYQQLIKKESEMLDKDDFIIKR